MDTNSSDTVAVSLNRDTARRVLHGECLHREHLIEVVRGEQLPESELILILKRDSRDDPQAIAEALVVSLGIVRGGGVIDADAPVPEGHEHVRFIEIGEDPIRNTRGREVREILRPIQFCE